jgi:hypothetical protein
MVGQPILAAGNAKLKTEFPLDGIDLMPVLTGKKKYRSFL